MKPVLQKFATLVSVVVIVVVFCVALDFVSPSPSTSASSASCAQAERFALLGIYKPKGIAIIFDTSTGTVSTTPLPQSLVQGSDQQ